MKIADSKIIRRFLIKFSRVETAYLRGIGVLHPACSDESEMWMTMEEFHSFLEFPCFDSKECLEKMEAELKRIDKEIGGN